MRSNGIAIYGQDGLGNPWPLLVSLVLELPHLEVYSILLRRQHVHPSVEPWRFYSSSTGPPFCRAYNVVESSALREISSSEPHIPRATSLIQLGPGPFPKFIGSLTESAPNIQYGSRSAATSEYRLPTPRVYSICCRLISCNFTPIAAQAGI